MKESGQRSDPFRLGSLLRFLEPSNPPLKVERAGLQFSIEEVVPKEIESRSPQEFGRVGLPRILRLASNNATVSHLMPTVS